MSRGSRKLTNSRKAEIINAFEELYQTMSFQNISMREIGEKTSMTRSSICHYFQTKEEIFLAMIARKFQQNFFIFLYGIDSYTSDSGSQKKALQYSGITYNPIQVYDVVNTFILHYLKQEV